MTPSHSDRITHVFLATGGATLLAISLATPASAHVHVTPEQASSGSYPTLTLKVPNESETASTTKIEVTLPSSAPFGTVSYQPVPGWKTQITEGKLPKPITTDDGTVTDAPTKVTWTATAGGIKPGEFQTFPISAGPVPNTGRVQLDAKQTYSDGKVVDWNEAQKGASEPEHPAPTVYVKEKAPAGAEATPSGGSPSVASTTSAPDSTDSTGMWLGAAGITLGAIALVTAVWAATRRR